MYKKAVFLGECMIELSGDISSLDKFSSNMQVNFGGDAYNSSVYFSRLVNKEVSTFFSTALSKDTFSRKMIDRFKREKIKCNYIRTDGENPPGLYSIEINKSGERSFRIPLGSKIPDFMGYDSRRARSYMREACLVPCAGDDSA